MHHIPVLVAVPMATEMEFLAPLQAEAGSSGTRFLVTGVGAGAVAALDAAIEDTPPASVLIVGFAGGLDPLVRHGDLVVATRVVTSGGASAAPDRGLTDLAVASAREAQLPVVSGALHTVGEPYLTPASKAVAFGRTGAVAVDMETYHLGLAAAASGIPFAAVRIVVDEAGDAVPTYLAGLATADLRTRVRTVVSHALRHPSDVPAIATLARAVRAAGPRMRAFVEAYLGGA